MRVFPFGLPSYDHEQYANRRVYHLAVVRGRLIRTPNSQGILVSMVTGGLAARHSKLEPSTPPLTLRWLPPSATQVSPHDKSMCHCGACLIKINIEHGKTSVTHVAT